MKLQALLSLFLLSLVAAGPMVTTQPTEDASAVLHNPDMGWVLYENYPIDPRPGGISTLASFPDETLPQVDAVAIMFAWSDIEKKPGEYDFSKVDHAYDYWKSRGKQLHLRMSTETLLWWNNSKPPAAVGMPQYLIDHLPPNKRQVLTESNIRYTVADARDPYYLDRLDHFLNAVEKHFTADRPVALIDLRGYGVWGEWHSGFQYKTLADRREALCDILDHYSKAFPDHWLALSYSHDPRGPAEYFQGPTDHYDAAFTKSYDDFLHYSAFDYAMTKPNITLRRDGVGGAVFSNQRKLNATAFATLTKGPMMAEFLQGYSDAKKGDAGWIKAMIDDALSLHSNYMNLIGYQCDDALNFLKERKGDVAYALRNMGYRLVPASATFPQSIQEGTSFQIKMTWVNRAVGRAMRDFHLQLRLVDATGKLAAVSDAGAVKTSEWIRGKTFESTNEAAFTSIQPGHYTLWFALNDPASDRAIALPLKNSDARLGYPLGPVEVLPAR